MLVEHILLERDPILEGDLPVVQSVEKSREYLFCYTFKNHAIYLQPCVAGCCILWTLLSCSLYFLWLCFFFVTWQEWRTMQKQEVALQFWYMVCFPYSKKAAEDILLSRLDKQGDLRNCLKLSQVLNVYPPVLRNSDFGHRRFRSNG